MKKFFLLAVVAMMGFAASAQLVQSTTLGVKHEVHAQWYIKAGMSINNVAGIDEEGLSLGSKVGEDVAFGFMRPIGKSGAYWGMEFGIGTQGASLEYEDWYGEVYKESSMAHAIKYSPFIFGYKISVSDNIAIDPHLGAFASWAFAGDDFDTDWNAGISAGAGIWWNKVNLDFSYQRGFVNIVSSGAEGNSSNFVIRLGYAF